MGRFLVVGGAGYVGSHVAKALAGARHEVVVFDNLSRGHRDFVRWGPLVVGDIRDRAQLSKVFSDYRFDAVLHFAALAYVGESMKNPEAYYDVNVCGSKNLLDVMIESDVKHLVFSSTCAVYGEPASLPISETCAANPCSPYGRSKLACEMMMKDYARAYGVRSIRLRYFNAAGADPDLEVGEDHPDETHLIPLVLEAARTGSEFRVFGSDYPTPDGTAIRDYIHVSDLADAHVLALEKVRSCASIDAVNLGTGEGVSVKQVIQVVQDVTGQRIRVRQDARRDGDPARLVADPSLAMRELKWDQKRSDLPSIVMDAWRWRLKRRG